MTTPDTEFTAAAEQDFVRAYGKRFPPGTNRQSIELWCFRHNHGTKDGGLGNYQHLRNAISLMWPEDAPRDKLAFIWSEWDDWALKAWCDPVYRKGDQEFQTWWGASATGKSFRAGIFALADWQSDPIRTAVTLVSTTNKALRERVWGYVQRAFYGASVPLTGICRQSRPDIIVGPQYPQGKIRGIALQLRTDQQAESDIVGLHNERNILIYDEMQGGKQIVVSAWRNLRVGQYARFRGLGNPMSRLDCLGTHSTPLGGWQHADDNMDGWQTAGGCTLRFDGLRSPALKHPGRHPWLIGQEAIDECRNTVGEDTVDWWSKIRGYIPPMGLVSTCLTETDVVAHDCGRTPTWAGQPLPIAGVDPAFDKQGNRAVFYPALVGAEVGGRTVVFLKRPETIDLKVTGQDTVTKILGRRVKELAEEHGIREPRLIAVDVTGQQRAFADNLDELYPRRDLGCTRIEFGGHPTENIVSAKDDRAGRDVYHNRVAELWLRAVEYARFGQLAGLTDADTLSQLCSRRRMQTPAGKWAVEDKNTFKSRCGRSPDEADALAAMLAMVREVMQIMPGGDAFAPGAALYDDVREMEAIEAMTYREENWLDTWPATV